MQTSNPFNSASGWPPWALWATIPVMLSLGFVTGLALATYQPAAPAPIQADAPPAGDPQDTASPDPAAPTGPGLAADQSWQVPESGLLANRPLPTLTEPPLQPEPDLSAPTPGVLPPPSGVYGQTAPLNLRDARTVLTREFSRYTVGNSPIRFDYQEMSHAGSRSSLVGRITVADYAVWEAALRTNPQALERWLESAAQRVQAAAQRDRFNVAWAVVSVEKSRPTGFANYEVTPLDDGSFLVTRPLAATVDFNSTKISLRSLDSLRLSALGQPVTSGGPWATYGPVIRFDSTDIYRPTSAAPQR